MDLIRELGELALATRLRRLSEKLMKDVSTVYRELGLPFQARWFSVFAVLGRRSSVSVTEVAEATSQTHTAVNQVARQLLHEGLLVRERDRRDDRRRLLSLSPRGVRLYRRLEPVWEEIRAANAELLEQHGIRLLQDLAAVEAALEKRSMLDRVRGRLALPPFRDLRIVDYRPAYKKYFKSLNEAWLREFFVVEEEDRILLEDPNRRIIKQGGGVLFALLEDRVAGTCALLRHDDGIWELTKMAVEAELRGRGIGRALVLAALERATAGDGCWLYLKTSPRLKEALRLYRRTGFRRVDRDPLPGRRYERCTIVMRRRLQSKIQQSSTR